MISDKLVVDAPRNGELCDHVQLELDDDMLFVHGPAHPYFGWVPSLSADMPSLRCSDCSRYTYVLGLIVKLHPTLAANRQA